MVHSLCTVRKMPPSPLALQLPTCSGVGFGGEEATDVPCLVAALLGSRRPPLQG